MAWTLIGNLKGPVGNTGNTGATGAAGIQVVSHGTNGSVARPTAPVVYWIGSATPVNALDYDFWKAT